MGCFCRPRESPLAPPWWRPPVAALVFSLPMVYGVLTILAANFDASSLLYEILCYLWGSFACLTAVAGLYVCGARMCCTGWRTAWWCWW
mmetsp:Transcript_49672/g.124607  ORF Transcript_49672/g.124607 Transcript_49672/m.124607 type:complete len:89 (+) Transcript_49672:196-462(+)